MLRCKWKEEPSRERHNVSVGLVFVLLGENCRVSACVFECAVNAYRKKKEEDDDDDAGVVMMMMVVMAAVVAMVAV